MEQTHRQRTKEEYAVVLDYLKHGYADDPRPLHRKEPIVQALGEGSFTLLELVPQEGIELRPFDRVYIGEGKRDKISYIRAALFPNKLTQTSKTTMSSVVDQIVSSNETKFIDFINKSGPLSLRAHQLELLPGIGKRHAEELITEREKEPFKNFEDVKKRVPAIADIKKIIINRLMDEIDGKDRYRLFVRV